jgi:hypothetical protein
MSLVVPSWHGTARRECRWAAACLALVLATPTSGWAAEAAISAADAEFFESRVRPLFTTHCAECHSRKAGDPEGGLSFDSRADFRAAEGVAKAGAPEASLLVQVVRYDGDLQMPPDGKLPAEAIRTIEEWVKRGLPWPEDGRQAGGEAFDIAARKSEHWCWHAPRAAATPAVQNGDWCRGEIDRFVLARLEAAGLTPAAEASRETLVRRASEILTGLPADPADVDRVARDPDPLAYEKYVDTLLASPQYGERFARHWLDVARYGESRGHESDYTIPNAFQYRDWVVRAINADVPYDQFVREQIAGDLVDRPRVDPATGVNESVLGTGFWFLGEEVHSPVDIKQDEADRIDNRVDTFGKAFLGLALGCARCHDHKFDAISNEDYYAIAGMLMSSSYRQVPFETLEANKAVAVRLETADRETRSRLLPLLADVVAAVPAAALPSLPALPATNPPPATEEVVIADYTRGRDATPLLTDASAWSLVPPVAPVLLPEVEGLPREVRLEAVGHAASDPVWSLTKTTGERDPGPLGQVDRAGRVLRTPKMRLTRGVLWHRVRGRLQIYAAVDSHVLLPGPLHGQTHLQVDTKGEWQWVRQDLTATISWPAGHVVHVEYVPITGGAAVAETVESLEQPRRPDPLALLAATAPDVVRQELVQGLRTDAWADPRRAAAVAEYANRLLASRGTDWTGNAARRLVAAAESLASAREPIVAEAKLVSAPAPAILDGNGIDQFVLLKGSAARPGDLAPRRFLEAVDGPRQPAWPAHSSGRRELADRVLDPANPLTSRVFVNRVWHHLFGRGLVPTPDNFGKLGEPAADPGAQALLDTLAVRFREEGWSVKQLVRQIVTSSAWRMSGHRDPLAVQKDPLNLLLHHAPLRRLEGEAIRDKLLAVSGRLDRTLGGPGVNVFLADHQKGARGAQPSGPLDGAGRRSLYIKIRRNFLPSFVVAFDMPVPFQAMGRRTVTNVPAQALALMNDPFVSQQAVLWARKTLADERLEPTARIERMYREAFARAPMPDERTAATEFLTAQARAHGVSFAEQPRHEATWADLAHALMNAKEFIFVP